MKTTKDNRLVSIGVASAISFLSLMQQAGLTPIGMNGLEFARATNKEIASVRDYEQGQWPLPLAHLDDGSLLTVGGDPILFNIP